MPTMWDVVAAERGSLAGDLAGLTAEQWVTPSLCDGWTCRDVVAHLSGTASTTPIGFLTGLIGSGFSFDKFIAKGIAANLGDSPEATLARFRELQHSTSAPPGPKTSWLGEVLIHGEDIRRPLGIAHTYPIDAVRQVADFYRGSNALIGAKTRITGLTLSATDTDWRHGSGPEVSGPLMSLVLAMTGRAAALADLTGDGVAVLTARMPSRSGD